MFIELVYVEYLLALSAKYTYVCGPNDTKSVASGLTQAKPYPRHVH